MNMDVRLAANRILTKVLKEQASLASLLPEYQSQVSDKDWPLLQELSYGTLRYHPQLAFILKQLLQKPLKNKDLDVTANLLCGLYQLLYTRIPEYAAISATVNVCKKLKKVSLGKLTNGVLRNFLRNKETLLEACESNPAAQYKQPDWILKHWQQAWPQQWQQLASGSNEKPPFTLRINTQKTNRTAYLEQLTEAGISAQACLYSSDGITLTTPCDVDALPGFREGWVSVQDQAAQLSAALLAPQAGERILDACCAPGGKTCHLLESQPDIHMVALDVDETRLARVQENLDRLQLSAELVCGDAADPATLQGQEDFDGILLDAPCSATGVIRRHPDIKCLRTPEDIQNLAKLQQAIAHNLWQKLKPGGRMLYATCSVMPEENSDVVAAFLQQHPDAEHLPIEASWGESQTFGRQLFPQSEKAGDNKGDTSANHDGFYYALIQKHG